MTMTTTTTIWTMSCATATATTKYEFDLRDLAGDAEIRAALECFNQQIALRDRPPTQRLRTPVRYAMNISGALLGWYTPRLGVPMLEGLLRRWWLERSE